MPPHEGQPVAHAGAPLDAAPAVMIMIHGRGASPRNILDLLPSIDRPDLAYLAPAAAGGTWYPFSFMVERERNEPGISSGLAVIDGLVSDLAARGFGSERVLLLGFSQGACLSSEYVIRHPRRYGGLLALSGGIIGPPGTTWDDITGSLDGTPVFLGCSDVDPHVPATRVLESEAVFRRLGAEVTRTFYPGMGHYVNEDEIGHVQRIVDDVLASVR